VWAFSVRVSAFLVRVWEFSVRVSALVLAWGAGSELS
jgi:hypothetical protein